jgi:hypothetical protein
MTIKIAATALDGGNYALYMSALVDVMKIIDPLLELRPLQTKGASENAALLKSGDVDVGLVSGELTHDLLNAVPLAGGRIGVVSVMFASPGMFAVRADSRFHRIVELKGRPIAWSVKNSGVEVQARYVMDGLGLDMDRDFQALYQQKFPQGPQLVTNGQAAALWGSGVRWPGFVELSNTPFGTRFVVPDKREIERICTKYTFMTKFVVPAGQYIGQYDPIETIGTWSFLLARPDLPEDMGFRLASSLYKAERLGALPKQLSQSTAKKTLAAISNPDQLSPGVAEFYRKQGVH